MKDAEEVYKIIGLFFMIFVFCFVILLKILGF